MGRFRTHQFLDMTKEEVMRIRGGKRKGTSRNQRRSADHQQYVHTYLQDGLAVPTDFDWRTERPGVVSPVKDQAMCGSCWIYGAIEPIESILAIRTGHLVPLPEQFLVDCTWTNNTGASNGNIGCDGGDSHSSGLRQLLVREWVLQGHAANGSGCKDR